MISVTGMANPISTRTDKVESQTYKNSSYGWRAITLYAVCTLAPLCLATSVGKIKPKLNHGDLPRRKIIYCTDHTELFLGYHFRQNRVACCSRFTL